MKYYILLLGCLLLSNSCFSQVPGNDSNWEIEFEDNFNDSSLFDTYYQLCNVNARIHCDNSDCAELQCYQRANITYDSGYLFITAKQESVFERVLPWEDDTVILRDGKPNKRWFHYTSGEFDTKVRRPSGYFEIRCRMPKGKGFWPAFWLYYNPGCDKGKEIDIFEPNGADSETADIYGTNMHYSYSNGGNCIAASIGERIENLPDMSLDFHKYAIEWAPGKIFYYYDDKEVRYLENVYVPEEAMTVIANLAIDPWNYPDSASFQSKSFVLDYIRYYQLKKDCSDTVTSTEGDNFNFITFDYKVKKSFSIKNSTVPTQAKVTLRATDFIELTTNFEAPVGCEFNAITTNCY